MKKLFFALLVGLVVLSVPVAGMASYSYDGLWYANDGNVNFYQIYNSSGYTLYLVDEDSDPSSSGAVSSGSSFTGAYLFSLLFINDSDDTDIIDTYTVNPVNPENLYEISLGTTAFFVQIDAAPVPIPGAVLLLGSGLVGLFTLRKKVFKG